MGSTMGGMPHASSSGPNSGMPHTSSSGPNSNMPGAGTGTMDFTMGMPSSLNSGATDMSSGMSMPNSNPAPHQTYDNSYYMNQISPASTAGDPLMGYPSTYYMNQIAAGSTPGGGTTGSAAATSGSYVNGVWVEGSTEGVYAPDELQRALDENTSLTAEVSEDEQTTSKSGLRCINANAEWQCL